MLYRNLASILVLMSVLVSNWACAGAAPSHYTQAQIKQLSLEISKSLRCPTSINQNLHGSAAPIAHELKAEIYTQLQQGRTKEQIIQFMVERYGEKIYYMPPLSVSTSLLFLFPLMLLSLAIATIWRHRYLSQHQRIAQSGE